MKGKIIKGVGGFYYIHVADGRLFECKAKGGFRNQGMKPAVGDDVSMEILDEAALLGHVVSINERKNKLLRPTVANVDQAMIIFALADPKPNLNLLDRFLIRMQCEHIPTIICFNKSDLVDSSEADKLKQIYENCGYEVLVTTTSYCMDASSNESIEVVFDLLKGKTTVLAGPSGVGKSSMLNALMKEDAVKTGSISEKIKRGKHTTRHSELICICEDTYIMDTPGFSSLFIEEIEEAEDLKDYYPEFEPYNGMCRFAGCVHDKEPDCAVKKAVEDGKISSLRYENYIQLYEERKNKRKW
ncbi:MAG: ribosome small subunit-dependent GTPase A [Lachnospiraceae bacterium]|nr:ribosome small subunit-dependent GTPase A [Lachnospiraceae bacterium]